MACVLSLLLAVPVLRSQSVVFSHDGGFYADTFSLAMRVEYAPAGCGPFAIHYTLNGNEPTECDTLYRGPLPITSDCYSRANLYRVQTVPDDRWYEPRGVERVVVVRAAAFDTAGNRRSAVNTVSFLIDSLLGRRIQLPVVSLCAESLSLFDHDTGIFMRGFFFNPAMPYSTGNYFQKGRLWERRASFAYYDSAGTALVQDCGLRVHGNSQRVLAQKGLSLYARRDYGEPSFNHAFFPNRRQEAFRRLVLRPWKTSWSAAGVEDWLCQRIADSLRFDNLASRPVVLFLNGEYWGVYFLEEKADEHYVAERHGTDKDSVDLLSYWGNEVENGSPARWNALYNWLQHADLSRQKDYDYLASQVDIDALTDYILMQLLVLNDDWPVNNVRFWAAGDRRWRWIFFDGDGTFSSFPDNSIMLDYMICNIPRKSSHTSPHATLLFRRLYANEAFRQRSLRRMGELVDSHFAYRRTSPLLWQIAAEVEPEVPHQIARFDTPASMTRWRVALEVIDDFLRDEPRAMMEGYARYFNLTAPAAETFAAYDRYGRQLLPPGSREEQLQSLPPGSYFLQYDDRRTETRKVTR